MPYIDIDNEFAFHPATETTGPLHDQVRELLRGTAHQLAALVPDGPLQTTAIRKLQRGMRRRGAAWTKASPYR